MAAHGGSSSLSYSVLEEDAASTDILEHFDTSEQESAPAHPPGRGLGAVSPGTARRGGACLLRGLRRSAPHLVLALGYLCFLLVGGGMFLALEGQHHPDEHLYTELMIEEYHSLKDRLGHAVLNLTLGKPADEDVMKLVDQYTLLVEESYLDDIGYVGDSPLTFAGSVLFCATTVTTIGYGDIVPATTGGKVLTIVYSLIGIPLSILFLLDVGRLLAWAVIAVANACRRLVRRSADGVRSRVDSSPTHSCGSVPAVVVFAILIAYSFVGALLIAVIESWNYWEALYFTYVTILTIGFGDLVPIQHHLKIASFVGCLFFIVLGLSVMSMCLVLLHGRVVAVVTRVAQKCGF